MRSEHSISAVAMLVGLMSAGDAAAGQSLLEIARTNGGVANVVIDVCGPLPSMQDVVHDADLVLRGQIAAVRTLLNADQSVVETEYTIWPIEVFKNVHLQVVKTPGTVPPIVVRRSGGRLVTEDGLRLGTYVNIFPEAEGFSAGEEALVMLAYRSDEKVYRFSHGAFSAFRIRDGLVIPMTTEVVRRRQDVPTPRARFHADLWRVLR